jgi:Arc/MetJ-type ribon-helix-helix transcriptional regulator
VTKVSTKRTRVTLPEDVVAGIDKLVGKRGRSAFLAEVAREEIQRRQQREALKAAAGSWKDKDHPELKGGSAARVRKLRAESEVRYRRIQQHRDRG